MGSNCQHARLRRYFLLRKNFWRQGKKEQAKEKTFHGSEYFGLVRIGLDWSGTSGPDEARDTDDQGGEGLKTRYTATNCINTGVFDVFACYKSRYRVIQELLQCLSVDS